MLTVPGKLLLATGETFVGEISANQNFACYGEVVFNTGMVGYVESLTDPSYAGQILVFTYPLIGNYGVHPQTSWESNKIHLKAVVIATMSQHYFHYAAQQSLLAWLNTQQIPYLIGADTRSITRNLRYAGIIPGAILPASSTTPPAFEQFSYIPWVEQVSIKEPCYYGSGTKTIILVDCGMKENILRCLLQFPTRIKRVPHDYDYSAEDFDGVVLSNGPGDPTHCTATINILKKVMLKRKPIFGICLGNQLLALAIGAKTYKLPFGHRSHNQPCMHLADQRCYLTSQNHSYAIDEHTLPQGWRVMFKNINDNSVEGITHNDLPFFAVQFHPEAAPGPQDTEWLFAQFYRSL